MTYTDKELFLTVQGEGANIGRGAVFISFAGCNLWPGDWARAVFSSATPTSSTVCHSPRWNPWPMRRVPCGRVPPEHTGGEPLLQANTALIKALKARSLYVAIETNGHAHCRTARLGLRQSQGRCA